MRTATEKKKPCTHEPEIDGGLVSPPEGWYIGVECRRCGAIGCVTVKAEDFKWEDED